MSTSGWLVTHGNCLTACGTIDPAGHASANVGNSHDKDRYVEARPKDQGRWLLHGHVHERWRVRSRMINVGVDAWNQAPVSEAELAAVIAHGPADIGAFEPLHA